MSVSIEKLRIEERGHRIRVDHEPLDMYARLNLAWCLFAQAMHQAGRENILADLGESGSVVDAPRETALRLCRDSEQLLRDCLHQMCAVCDLSRDPNDIADVERLRYLVVVSGAESALMDADAESARLLTDMASAIVSSTLEPNCRKRGRVPRMLY